MQQTIYKSEDRGSADHGWLKAKHTFSFGSWHNPKQMHFGVLRVLNDDIVSGGMGFGMHPHDNMEIITIPLEGTLEHKDSMGNIGVVKTGEVQVMSAGTGVQHSEYNHSQTDEVKLFQIWLFPNKKNVAPRYDQRSFDVDNMQNQLLQIVNPMHETEGLGIHQDAWFYRGDLEAQKTITYNTKKENNGFYMMVIDGEIKINDVYLQSRDAIGIWNTNEITIEANSTSKILLMDVPMTTS
jgi:redox-sensitive bicupin YhaK (pirin superfamily)